MKERRNIDSQKYLYFFFLYVNKISTVKIIIIKICFFITFSSLMKETFEKCITFLLVMLYKFSKH